jgi:hypothetical protein
MMDGKAGSIRDE